MPDPLTLASSIVAFVDAAVKLKDSFSKASKTKRRLRIAMTEVLRGIASLETSIRTRASLLGESESQDVKEILKDAQSAIADFQPRFDQYLAEAPRGLLSTAASGAKAWFHRNAIEAAIQRLEAMLRSCQLRFSVIMSVRTEYAVVTSHQEHLDRLTHFEDLVSYMIVRKSREDGSHPSLMVGMEPSEIDFQFLERQVHKLASVINDRRQLWATMEKLRRVSSSITETFFAYTEPAIMFPATLRPCLSILKELNEGSRTVPPQSLFGDVFTISNALRLMDKSSSAVLLLAAASSALHLLGIANPSLSHQRSSALIQSLSANVALQVKDPNALESSEQAVKAWQTLYNKSHDNADLYLLMEAISLYDLALFRHGDLEESLDCSRQVLLLLRTAPDVEQIDSPIVTWTASGEADVVYSSDREMSWPFHRARTEGLYLWNVAKSLATLGQYANARIAAMDALSCREACAVAVQLTKVEVDIMVRMRAELATWVSIIQNPVARSRTMPGAFILTDDESSEDDGSAL
ncbi:hypothetical protein HGRIS_014667 [Hohenbuehelia grisea]